MHIQRMQNYNHQTSFKQIYPINCTCVREFYPETQKMGPLLDDFNFQPNLVTHVYKSPLQEGLKLGYSRLIIALANGQAFQVESQYTRSKLCQLLNSATDGIIATRVQQQDAELMRETMQSLPGKPHQTWKS